MYKNLKDLYLLLSDKQRKKLLRLQVLVVLMSFCEIAGVVSVGPFMAIVGDMSLLHGSGIVAQLYTASGMADPQEFLFWVGVGVLFVLTSAALVSMFTIWRLSMYGARVGAELSSRLFEYYMNQPWLFHSSGSSSQLTNKISQECLRVTNNVVNPLMRMNAKLMVALFMVVVIFVINPKVAIIGVVVFGVAYFLLYRTVRQKLSSNGDAVTAAQRRRYQLMSESFGGIKDVLLLGRQSIFTQRFEYESSNFAHAQGATQSMTQVPRYAMELVAFGSVIFLVLYLLSTHAGDLGSILPMLSVYALAGFKLLPAFQQIYSSLTEVRGNIAAFEALHDDLRASKNSSRLKDNYVKQYADKDSSWTPKYCIRLDNVDFSYPGKQEKALDRLTMDIPVNRVVGLVGASGSGKSTAIDLLLGLIEPERGRLLVDGQAVTDDNRRTWQNSLGYVPQSIFLADASILENIAFGLPKESIDEDRVRRAIAMAHLDEFVKSLVEGWNTRVGERGVQLSGGQRQRIGIARALYHDADVLVLDEATSALDGITEKLIMDAIHDFSGKKTIIMIAHRLATVKKCDIIYLLSSGEVVGCGDYDHLVKTNMMFKRMAEHA